MKKILIIFLVVAIACVMIANHKVAPASGLGRGVPLTTTPAIPGSASPPEIPVESKPPIQPRQADVPPITEPQKIAAQAAQSAQPTRQKDPIHDPVARIALSFVGADPDAEAYWIDAINNPDLSAEERQNLIEDLNEDGLSDPENPTADDLPLIENRILLIEDIAPDAMDDVNAAAFQEAYKDLMNMYVRLTRN